MSIENVVNPPDLVETTETPLWRFENHPDQQTVLDENRSWQVDTDWWEYTYEAMQEQWAAIGLDVPYDDMWFTGFCSQGDGACFAQCKIDWTLFWPTLTGKYPFLARYKHLLPQPELHHRGRYYHEYSVSIDLYDAYSESETAMIDAAILSRYPKMTPYQQGEYTGTFDLWNELSNRYRDRFVFELDRLREEVTELLRQKMRELYAALEAEYDYLTSDEYLSARFTEEDLMFEEDGTIHYV